MSRLPKRVPHTPPEVRIPYATYPSEEVHHGTPGDLEAHAGPEGARPVTLPARQVANLLGLHRQAKMIAVIMQRLDKGSSPDWELAKEIRRWLPPINRLVAMVGVVEDEALLTKRGL